MLRETTPNQWSNSRLNDCINDADAEIFRKFGRVRDSGWNQFQETITLLANASTFSLTPGSNPTAFTKALAAIAFIEHQGPSGFWNLCNELREADEFRYRAQNAVRATGDVPPLYRLRQPNLVCLPVATVDRTLRVTGRFEVTAMSSDTDTMNCPDKAFALVSARAKIFALEDLGEADDVTSAAYELLTGEMYEELGHPNAEGRPLTIKPVDGPAVFNF